MKIFRTKNKHFFWKKGIGYDLIGVRKCVLSADTFKFRRLWLLVSNLCSFTDEQYDKGCFNNFEEFVKDEAFRISQCLETYLNTNRDYNWLMFYLFVKDAGGCVITQRKLEVYILRSNAQICCREHP